MAERAPAGTTTGVAGLDLRPLLDPESIAVVGASPRGGFAASVFENVARSFRGRLYAVNPNYAAAFGRPCYPSCGALPEAVDCAAIAVRRERVLAALDDAIAAGARAAVVYASGFAEADAEGAALQAALVERARAARIPVAGPNCMGFINVPSGALAMAYHLPEDLQPGPVAAIIQSGSVCYALTHNDLGIGFNVLVSAGNEAVVTAADYVAYAAARPDTRAIVCFLETIRAPERFLRAVAAARARRIPVIVLKVGRSQLGRRLALAHTGALVGSDAAYDAVFRKAGIVRVDTLNELFATVEAFLPGVLPAGDGAAFVTDSGGERLLVADLAEELGVRFAELAPATRAALDAILPFPAEVHNPLDAWGLGDAETAYPRCLEALVRDPEVHAVVLATDMVRGAPESRIYADAALAVARRTPDKLVAVLSHTSYGLDAAEIARARAGGVAVLRGTESGLRALGHLMRFAAHLRAEGRPRHPALPRRRAARRPAGAAGDPGPAARRRALREWRHPVFPEYQAKRLLEQYGLPVTREHLVYTADEAVQAAQALGFPVCLKLNSPALSHRTDVGGIVLDVAAEAGVRDAFGRLAAILDGRGLTGRDHGVVVQEMLPRGTEVLLGMNRDPDFGPVIALGLGGVWAEAYRDVAVELPPLGADEVLGMIRRLRGRDLLLGGRGQPPADVDALVALALDFSRFVEDWADDLEAADLNPVIVYPAGASGRAPGDGAGGPVRGGVRVADALLVRRRAGGPALRAD